MWKHVVSRITVILVLVLVLDASALDAHGQSVDAHQVFDLVLGAANSGCENLDAELFTRMGFEEIITGGGGGATVFTMDSPDVEIRAIKFDIETAELLWFPKSPNRGRRNCLRLEEGSTALF